MTHNLRLRQFLIVGVLLCSVQLLAEGPKCVQITETPNLKQDLKTWMSLEDGLGIPAEHQRRLIISPETNSQQDQSILVIHGLYNSPAWMNSILDVFENQNSPVMMSRLLGHFEPSERSLKEIEWIEWLKEAERDFALARRLGKKVVCVGHSTGSLLLTWVAMQHPEQVQALVLFSPAFGVHWFSQMSAWFGKITGISLKTPNGKVLVGHAGIEIVKASRAFREYIHANSHEEWDYIAEKLKSIPIWMGNTRSDIVIQQGRSRDFMQAFRDHNPENKPREEYWIPLKKFVPHDAITTGSNSEIMEMKKSLSEFLIRAGVKKGSLE